MTGEEFRELRKKAGFTQLSLGEALGFKGRGAVSMVQKWEYDERSINPKYYRKLSELLGVPPERFIPW